MKRQNERLKQQLDAARRAGFRRAAPFAKDRRQGHGGQPGRRAGPQYGRRARRSIPARVDEPHDAPLPATCPDCTGPVIETGIAMQYQEDLPPVRPIIRAFHVHIGQCQRRGRRVQGRHALQTSDALGAAAAQLNRKVCGGNRTWLAAQTQQILMTVFRTSRQCALDPLPIVADLLRARTPRVAAALVPT